MLNSESINLEFDELANDTSEREFANQSKFKERERESQFTESEEIELASELLDVSSEAELDQFLERLFWKVGRRTRQFSRFFGRALRPLRSLLKQLARTSLPIAGRFVGGCSISPSGAVFGSKLASKASRIFELELEGLSPEDQEFEIARQFIRLADAATKNVALDPATLDPQLMARRAIAAAAIKYAPGLLQPGFMKSLSMSDRNEGRWIRHRRTIILPEV